METNNLDSLLTTLESHMNFLCKTGYELAERGVAYDLGYDLEQTKLYDYE